MSISRLSQRYLENNRIGISLKCSSEKLWNIFCVGLSAPRGGATELLNCSLSATQKYFEELNLLSLGRPTKKSL